MNKGQLIDLAAEKADSLTKRQVAEALDAILTTIQEGVATEGKVVLVGFGTFEAVLSKAREGRNPKTGEVIQIPEKKVVRFSAGKDLKESVL